MQDLSRVRLRCCLKACFFYAGVGRFCSLHFIFINHRLLFSSLYNELLEIFRFVFGICYVAGGEVGLDLLVQINVESDFN